VKEDEKGRTCSTNWEEKRNAYKALVEKREGRMGWHGQNESA
jgi:hypothetical protein